jgi:hypothetical protein
MATDNDEILGVWELVGWELEQNGSYTSVGANAQGLLIYTTSRMSVTITSDGPNVFYAGTYDLRGNAMVHHAELSFDLANFRNVQRRVELSGDSLVLRTPAEDKRQVRLTWRRIARLP